MKQKKKLCIEKFKSFCSFHNSIQLWDKMSRIYQPQPSFKPSSYSAANNNTSSALSSSASSSSSASVSPAVSATNVHVPAGSVANNTRLFGNLSNTISTNTYHNNQNSLKSVHTGSNGNLLLHKHTIHAHTYKHVHDFEEYTCTLLNYYAFF